MQRYLLYFAFFAFVMLIFLKLWEIRGDKISGEYFSISFLEGYFSRLFFSEENQKERKTLA